MAANTQRTPLEPRGDIRTDYVLIATGIGAAFIALIYLILI
jgi:hypothetical protein